MDSYLGWVVQAIVDETARNGYKKVGIQFAPSFLAHAVYVITSVEEKVAPLASVPEFFILADSTYVTCCVDEVSAKKFFAEAVFYVGPGCYTALKTLPCAYLVPSVPPHPSTLTDLHAAAEDAAKRNATLHIISHPACRRHLATLKQAASLPPSSIWQSFSDRYSCSTAQAPTAQPSATDTLGEIVSIPPLSSHTPPPAHVSTSCASAADVTGGRGGGGGVTASGTATACCGGSASAPSKTQCGEGESRGCGGGVCGAVEGEDGKKGVSASVFGVRVPTGVRDALACLYESAESPSRDGGGVVVYVVMPERTELLECDAPNEGCSAIAPLRFLGDVGVECGAGSVAKPRVKAWKDVEKALVIVFVVSTFTPAAVAVAKRVAAIVRRFGIVGDTSDFLPWWSDFAEGEEGWVEGADGVGGHWSEGGVVDVVSQRAADADAFEDLRRKRTYVITTTRPTVERLGNITVADCYCFVGCHSAGLPTTAFKPIVSVADVLTAVAGGPFAGGRGFGVGGLVGAAGGSLETLAVLPLEALVEESLVRYGRVPPPPLAAPHCPGGEEKAKGGGGEGGGAKDAGAGVLTRWSAAVATIPLGTVAEVREDEVIARVLKGSWFGMASSAGDDVAPQAVVEERVGCASGYDYEGPSSGSRGV